MASAVSYRLQSKRTQTFPITPVVHFYPEFFDFCDCVYKHKPSPRNLSSEKVYRFMFYPSFREKNPSRGKLCGGGVRRFDREEYDRIMG
jgi:hypothetical protein